MEAVSGSKLQRELVLVLGLAIVIALDTLSNSANNVADMAHGLRSLKSIRFT